MSELVRLFLNNLLPIFLATGTGVLLGHFFDINPRSLSQAALYIFSPCLVFSLLTKTSLNHGELGFVVLIALLVMLAIGFLSWIIGKGMNLERRMLSSFILSTMFINAGNYGLPVTLFAFGTIALGYASIFFVTSAVLINTLGVFIASMGTLSARNAFLNLFRIPLFYATILGFLVIQFDLSIPLPIERTIEILGDASIPVLMVLLGLQLRTASWRGFKIPLVAASVMRLLVSPVIAVILVSFLFLNIEARQAVILEAAMPSAVMTTLLATEFDADTNFVTAVVFTTTLLSPITLTPLLIFLGA